MGRWLGALLGSLLGGAAGLFGPVFLLKALGHGSGSYEDVLFAWFVAVPLGLVVGGAVGVALGRRAQARSR